MAWLWRNYSLSIVLVALFLIAWIGQTVTGWQQFIAEQQSHGQAAEIFGSEGYIWPWAQATLENWQSEFLQLLAFVVLTSFLIHKGSPESRESDEEMKQTLERIEARLTRLERQALVGRWQDLGAANQDQPFDAPVSSSR